ncbi:hypothetical protein J4731_10255 [Providencia rettgeri]|nr:hypothetical protein [Providencia rettgeri]
MVTIRRWHHDFRGEPFEQPEALSALVKGIKQLKDADILVYSGYQWEHIEERVYKWLLILMP